MNSLEVFMKKIGELLKEIGFNPHAPEESQKALMRFFQKEYKKELLRQKELLRSPFKKPGEEEKWEQLKLKIS
ncbi:MAG: hypothetical protein D6797_07395 [Bdellovibrio sp.]|nr:MAG: hypothetical protein D6797_07395 [Bdellovibrio sp.]